MWVESMGVAIVDVVVRRYIYRFPHITYPYSSCICSFLQQHPYFLFIKKNVFRSCSSTFLCVIKFQRFHCRSPLSPFASKTYVLAITLGATW